VPAWLSTNAVYVPMYAGFTSEVNSIEIVETPITPINQNSDFTMGENVYWKIGMDNDMFFSYDIKGYNSVILSTNSYNTQLLAGFRRPNQDIFSNKMLVMPGSFDSLITNQENSIFDLVAHSSYDNEYFVKIKAIHKCRFQSMPHQMSFVAPETGNYELIVGTYPSQDYLVTITSSDKQTMKSSGFVSKFEAAKNSVITIDIPKTTLTIFVGYNVWELSS